MGIFSKKVLDPKDMSLDESREKFIIDSMSDNNIESPIPVETIDLEPPHLPDLNLKDWKEEQEKPKVQHNELMITLVVRAKNKELIAEMVDGVADILEKHGEDAIVSFNVAKFKE